MLEILHGKRVFLTGHTGFKGSWLSIWLSELGADVFGYSLSIPTSPSHFEASRVDQRLTRDERGDLLDQERLNASLQQARPDVVIHMAAQPLVRTAYASPRETMQTNVMGTVNLLDAVRAYAQPCVVVVVTSDKCYRDDQLDIPFTEDAPLGGNDPYSASKAAAEIVASCYRSSFFRNATPQVSLATVRAGNVIGGGDWAVDRLIPDLVASIQRQQTVEIRMPQAIRPWQHVLEPLSGYLQLIAHQLTQPSETWNCGWNFGPAEDSMVSVETVVRTFFRYWGAGNARFGTPANHLPETRVLTLSSQKAANQLGWQPRWQLPAALEHTARWYANYYADPSQNMIAHSLRDIHAFQAAEGVVA